MVDIAQQEKTAERVAEMRRMVGAKNDNSLSRMLGVAPPVISKVKHGKLPIGAALIVSLHEETGMSTKEIKARLGLMQMK